MDNNINDGKSGSARPQEQARVDNKWLANAIILERRRERRWRNIRFFGWFIILFLIVWMLMESLGFIPSKETLPVHPYVSMVRLEGVIMPSTSFSAEEVIPELNSAFSDSSAKGVVLVINSPGGSPVQAAIINDKITMLKKKYNKKVIVIGEDALASGAYLVAAAADKIYVNKDTLTGSIGVILNGFGVNTAMDKLGVSRRVFTAGVHKDRLDPFKPLDPDDAVKAQKVLDAVHKDFINYVIQGRGDRLKGDRAEIFSGDFWTGSQAVELGLADGTDNLWSVLDKEFKVSYYRDYTTKKSIFESLLKGVNSYLPVQLQSPAVPIRAQLMLNS